MDSALDKVNLYDFFSVLATGVLTVIMAFHLHFSLPFLVEHTENEIINLIMIVVECYFFGNNIRGNRFFSR